MVGCSRIDKMIGQYFSNLTNYANFSIIRTMDSQPKPIEWIASTLDDLKDFPEDVQQAVGYALYRA
jgi:hypothetical protein